MKILLLGKNGQVGWELQRSLAPLGELVALCSASQEMCGDLTRFDDIRQTIKSVSPDVIVNASAYTAVDKAESDIENAEILNAHAPGMLAQEAKACNACLIHYSTDYVFNGKSNSPYSEIDLPDPLNVYGKTKLQGENNIIDSGCNHLIFRTSWVYGAHGNNFIKTILRLSQQRDKLSIVNDQIGSPTGAELIADVTAHAVRAIQLRPELAGLYHLAARGHTSWYEFADFILQHAEPYFTKSRCQLTAIPSTDYPTPAKRPLNSRLNTTKLEQTFGLNFPNWQNGVLRVLTELLTKSDFENQ
ncbi:MAG TPA: dTDP-4-dehydrorhamnose reductase [Nitrosomonas sp.]|nr:dTDP-4-dehydrorhamnose reductase [Nitrosomonas sp.]HQX12891.1 dTDP-4-dehydrorhamnose reductase [Nitrosomonas sp.]HRB33726.1 dTDP-4-dehydrorhamnose reductase [Nitrosomonas sp.]HRB46609.1 dTDP-4-dehydrorhamnose reductase [Nitrosomonas sp.]HRB77571.1 dTDP-4-dehydrorhamnose reductase [Nitrosomonas sp.]